MKNFKTVWSAVYGIATALVSVGVGIFIQPPYSNAPAVTNLARFLLAVFVAIFVGFVLRQQRSHLSRIRWFSITIVLAVLVAGGFFAYEHLRQNWTSVSGTRPPRSNEVTVVGWTFTPLGKHAYKVASKHYGRAPTNPELLDGVSGPQDLWPQGELSERAMALNAVFVVFVLICAFTALTAVQGILVALGLSPLDAPQRP